MVLLELDGKSSLMAFGLTRVEVSIKNISSRNTRSDMDAILNSVLILFCDFIAINECFGNVFCKTIRYFAGS
jgi:hypothetical protein